MLPARMAGRADGVVLVGLVGDKTDDALVSMINEHGVDTFIGGIFEEMAKRFLPDKAAGRTVVIEYDITMPESTEIYQLDVAGGACSVSKGASKEASVALTLAAPDFLRLITGKLNGVNAFMSGKLKLKGDLPTIVRYTKASQELTECTTRVQVRWPDET